jgi:hypothetical protein
VGGFENVKVVFSVSVCEKLLPASQFTVTALLVEVTAAKVSL